MPSPLVSFVIPIFNQSRFVVETVGSALRQTYSNLQVVVVDDGSTDGSSELLQREFGNDITLIRQDNAGPSMAINTGLAAARGSFVALLGGDDVCMDDRIATQLDIMGSTAHDIIFSKPQLIDDAGDPMDDDAFPVFFRTMPREALLRVLLFDGNFLCAPSAFMRRDVVERLGPFHPGLVQLQDYEYWMRALSQGMSVGEFEPRVVRYRRHSENLSSPDGSFASSAEAVLVFKSILDRGDATHIRSAFPHCFAPVANLASPLTRFDKALLMLAHPSDGVRMAGVERVAALFGDAEFAERAKTFGFNLFRFVRNATKK